MKENTKFNKKQYLYRLITFVFIGISIIFPRNSFAFLDFIKFVGHNAESMGRGGTSIGIGDEPSNANFNPAIISETKANVLEVNLFLTRPDLDYEYTGTDGKRYTSSNKDRFGMLPGMAYAYNNKDTPWSFGFLFSIPDGFMTDYTVHSKYFGSVNASSEIIHLRAAPVVAYQVTPKLSLGLRIGLDYASFDLRSPLGIAYLDAGQADGFGYSGAIGIHYKPVENLSLGLYYENTKMNQIKTQNKDGYLKFADGTNINRLDIGFERFQFPQHFGFGIAYTPYPDWRFSADVKYIDWSKNWKNLELKVYDPPPGAPATLKIPLDMNDQIPFSLGVEYFINDMYTLSLGYHYNDNAMPGGDHVNPIVATEVDHLVTCGFSVMPVDTVKIGAAFFYSIMARPKCNGLHAYDKSLNAQLGTTMDTELCNAKADYTNYSFEFSVTIFYK